MNIGNSSWKNIFFYSSVLLCIALFVHGLLIYNSKPENKPSLIAQGNKQDSEGKFAVSIKNAPVWGKKDAPVTVLEFSDFDCPFCKKAYTEILQPLKTDYIDNGKVKFIYRNMPLEIHPNARLKAVAALCAKALKNDNVYFTYHNQLFDNNASITPVHELLNQFATQDGIDISTFEKCQKEQKLSDQVDLDIADAYQFDATGTPSWFIGKTDPEGTVIKGIRVVGTQPYSVYRILINQLLTE